MQGWPTLRNLETKQALGTRPSECWIRREMEAWASFGLNPYQNEFHIILYLLLALCKNFSSMMY